MDDPRLEAQALRQLVGQLGKAGLTLSEVRRVHCVPLATPVRRNVANFEGHSGEDVDWGKAQLEVELRRAVGQGAELLMPLGNNALEWLAPSLPFPPRWGEDAEEEEAKGRITAWRGSLMRYGHEPFTLDQYAEGTRPSSGPYLLPSYHPAAIARQFDWHPWGVMDFRKAKAFLSGEWAWPKQRVWRINDYAALPDFVERMIASEHLVAVDSEMSPYHIIALCSEEEVHAFAWDERARGPLTKLMASPSVLKVAHNAGHDWTFFRVELGVDVKWPSVDTSGLAHILDSSLPRNLSPAIASRFTTWPYHKWLVNHDPLRYCGYDAQVCYDAYWTQLREVCDRGLLPVAEHDHKLLEHLLNMQWTGLRIDEVGRLRAVVEVSKDISKAKWEWRKVARPVVRTKWKKFEKPHLFRSMDNCECCGGGKVTRQHCWRCGGLPVKPTKKEDYRASNPKSRVADLRAALPYCRHCAGVGKVERWRALHGAEKVSPDQVADVLYRGLGITPRRFKGKETIRADQLAPLADKWPIIQNVLDMADGVAQKTTMERLEPDGRSGRLHPTYDPWGTARGRTAAKAGLIQGGTNVQNLEKKYRYVITADPGYLLVAPDMSQIQGRALAAASKDPTLRTMYFETPIDWPGHKKHGLIDAHTVVQQVYHKLGAPISRDQAKRQTYAMFFDVSAAQLAVEMSSEAERKGEGCRVDEMTTTRALAFLWAKFPKVQSYYRGLFQECLRTRRVTSPTGRQATWNGYIYDKKTKGLVHKVQKEIRAFPLQDMEAWVMALNLEEIVKRGKGLVTPLIHVHDEFVAQIPETPGALVDEAVALIRACMTRTEWNMPFPVGDILPSKNWYLAKGGE